MACVGQNLTESSMGSTVEEVLGSLSAQFCGCTSVYGSVVISLDGLTSSWVLNETDFNFLYHLEQISGALIFNGIPETTRIILPNLRIIRGQGRVGDVVSLYLVNASVGEIIIPKLTEISQGSVFLEQPPEYPICNWANVNWEDIIDNGTIVESFVDCSAERTYKLFYRIAWLWCMSACSPYMRSYKGYSQYFRLFIACENRVLDRNCQPNSFVLACMIGMAGLLLQKWKDLTVLSVLHGRNIAGHMEKKTAKHVS